jgi:N-methylhydantoinase B
MASNIDPITLQVIRNALKAAAEEMQISLVKTAHNPLIYEVQDFGVALLSRKGELLAEGSGLPNFLGCLPPVIQSALNVVGADQFAEGDLLLANEPYDTGTHISDTAVYMPIFADGRLVAFSCIMAHWADIGGKTPGGWCPDTTDVHQEGLIFSHVKLYERGVLNRALHRLILTNVRFPDLVDGDLNAMIASCRTGARRYQALCEKYGAQVLEDAMEAVFDLSEKYMRQQIAQIPAGDYTAEVYLDHDGVELDKPRRLCVTVSVRGDTLHVDWTGTDPAATGPINNPFPGTVALAQMALKALTIPLEATNHGHMRPLIVTAPDNTIVSPSYPAPCDSYGYVGEMIVHLVVRALSSAIPERCPACSYQMFGAYFYRSDPRHGTPFIFVDPVDGGGGAFPFADGPTGLIFVGDGDVPNTPIEIIESRYPLLVRRYTINPEGAGAGQYRGGFGVIRDYEALEDYIFLQTMNENTLYPPWGLHGGGSSGISRLIVWEGTPREQVLTGRVYFFGPLMKGDRVSARSTGGGGWGDPRTREAQAIADDIRNGLITAEAAAATYSTKERA